MRVPFGAFWLPKYSTTKMLGSEKFFYSLLSSIWMDSSKSSFKDQINNRETENFTVWHKFVCLF